jgi:hypothetical protein
MHKYAQTVVHGANSKADSFFMCIRRRLGLCFYVVLLNVLRSLDPGSALWTGRSRPTFERQRDSQVLGRSTVSSGIWTCRFLPGEWIVSGASSP